MSVGYIELLAKIISLLLTQSLFSFPEKQFLCVPELHAEEYGIPY